MTPAIATGGPGMVERRHASYCAASPARRPPRGPGPRAAGAPRHRCADREGQPLRPVPGTRNPDRYRLPFPPLSAGSACRTSVRSAQHRHGSRSSADPTCSSASFDAGASASVDGSSTSPAVSARTADESLRGPGCGRTGPTSNRKNMGKQSTEGCHPQERISPGASALSTLSAAYLRAAEKGPGGPDPAARVPPRGGRMRGKGAWLLPLVHAGSHPGAGGCEGRAPARPAGGLAGFHPGAGGCEGTVDEPFLSGGKIRAVVNLRFTHSVPHSRTVDKAPRGLVPLARVPPWGGAIPRKH